jgi:hypothetical protein
MVARKDLEVTPPSTFQALRRSLQIILVALILTVLVASILTTRVQPTYGFSTSIHPGTGIQQTPDSVVAAFDAALNTHDVNAGLNLFADTGLVRDAARETYSTVAIPRLNPAFNNQPVPASTCGSYLQAVVCTYSGKDQIGAWLQQLALEHTQVQEIGNRQVTGDNVSWNLAISNDNYQKLGLPSLMEIGQATVQGGKIELLTLSFTTDSITKLIQASVKSTQPQATIETNGFLVGIAILGLVLPLGTIQESVRRDSELREALASTRNWSSFASSRCDSNILRRFSWNFAQHRGRS